MLSRIREGNLHGPTLEDRPTLKEGTVKRTRHPLRRNRSLYPATLPSYLLPPASGEVVFDPSLRRAGEAVRLI
jgi:hypothetical protein